MDYSDLIKVGKTINDEESLKFGIKKRKIWVYLEKRNIIVSTLKPIFPKKLLKYQKKEGILNLITLHLPGEDIYLCECIYARTQKECLIKVKKYFQNKIKTIKYQRADQL